MGFLVSEALVKLWCLCFTGYCLVFMISGFRCQVLGSEVQVEGPDVQVEGPGWVSGFGFREQHLPLMVDCLVFMISGFRCQVSVFDFLVEGPGFWVSGLRCQVLGFVLRGSCFGVRVSGFGFRVSGAAPPTSPLTLRAAAGPGFRARAALHPTPTRCALQPPPVNRARE